MKGVCELSVIPMRMEASDRSEMVNQVLMGETFSIIETQENAIGFISISNENEAFLNKFYILQSEQGKGIGKFVFSKILEIHSSIKIIRLTVNRKNFKSINFYFTLGFKIESVEDFFIGTINFFVCGPLWEKEFLNKQEDLFNESLRNGDDWDFNLRMLYKAINLVFLKTANIQNRVHQNSLSKERNKLNKK